MNKQADFRFTPGRLDYTVAWILLTFFGMFGIHRMYMGKWVTGTVFLFTLGLAGFGYLWDFFTLNDQVSEINQLG